MKRFLHFLIPVIVAINASCSAYRKATPTDNGKIEMVLVQVNDVYEIAPLSRGKEGGMARVATLKKQYQQNNPNTFLVMAGDFVSPSVYNSLQYEGKAIRGKQMIEAMNAAGTDLVVFGNHEFDIKETELQDRINESRFQWIASNVFHQKKDTVMPFSKTIDNNAASFSKTHIKTITDKDGTTAKIGFIGITLPFNKADYVFYTDPMLTAKELYGLLKDSVDAVVAITHQSIEEDVKLAKELPQLAAIIGGHEHDMRFEKVGNLYVTKAHANAKSAYAVSLKINKKKRKTKAKPELIYLDEKIGLDSATNMVVQKWTQIAENNYSSLGFDAKRVIMNSGDPLDGHETAVRSHPTNLTQLITAAMAAAAPQADVVLFNAGSIRVDDILPMPITEYDLIRSLPFGGGLREVEMKGSLLVKTLEQGRKNTGIGGFLHYNEAVSYDTNTGTWKIKDVPIDPAKTYRVAMAEFLLTGKEANLDFLNPGNPEMVKVYDADTTPKSPQSDIRLAVIDYLKKK